MISILNWVFVKSVVLVKAFAPTTGCLIQWSEYAPLIAHDVDAEHISKMPFFGRGCTPLFNFHMHVAIVRILRFISLHYPHRNATFRSSIMKGQAYSIGEFREKNVDYYHFTD